MENNTKKDIFFKTYLNNLTISKDNKKKILNSFIYKNSNNNINIKSENSIELTLLLELHLTCDIFVLNFRQNLIDYIKNKYEYRAYYLFYIDSINYTTILNSELPLIKKVGEYYILNLPVEVTLVYFKKNDIVQLNLVFDINQSENKINIYATNKYILCSINTNNQIIENNTSITKMILRDQKSGQIFKNNNLISVKILEFFNNQLEEGFTSKINCSGEIVIL